MKVMEYLRRYGVPDTKMDYKVNPMDVISVTVFDEPELSRENLRVSSRGKISLPLLGELNVTGLSPRKIEQLIQIRYRQENILKHPQVSVHINEFKGRRVLILGAVNTPGNHFKEGNERLAEMLAKAGGIKFDADGDVAANKIRILRTVKVPRPTQAAHRHGDRPRRPYQGRPSRVQHGHAQRRCHLRSRGGALLRDR